MVPVVERMLALLALLALGVTVVTLVLVAARRVPTWLRDEVAMPLAAAVAVVATAGSLFASEVAGYPPCALCWYQRAAMYPLAGLLPVAAWRGWTGSRNLGVPVSLIGAGIAGWHIAVERLPAAPTARCDPAAPCSVLWVDEFGVLTLPTMALIGFVTIAILLVVARPGPSDIDRAPATFAGSDRKA